MNSTARLLLIAFMIVLSMATLSHAGINDGLILHFPFITNEGATIADQSGNGNDGAVSGATFVTDPIRGGVMQFDGNDYINLGDFSDAEGQHELTFGCWVLPNAEGLFGLIGKTRSNDETFHLVADCRGARNIEATVVPADRFQARIAAIPGTIQLSTWQHLMAVYDGHQTKLYHNGVVVTQSPYFASSEAVRSNNVSAAVGDCSAGRGWYMRGSIDDVRVYNRALSAAEVLELYNMDGEPEPSDDPWLQKLGFSNTPEGPWDVTEFMTGETLYVRLEDVDVDADSSTLRTRVHITQPRRRTVRPRRTSTSKKTRTADRSRAGATIFMLDPQEDGTLTGSLDLSLLSPGEVYITVTAVDTDDHYVYQRRSTIYLSAPAGARLEPETRTRTKR